MKINRGPPKKLLKTFLLKSVRKNKIKQLNRFTTEIDRLVHRYTYYCNLKTTIHPFLQIYTY